MWFFFSLFFSFFFSPTTSSLFSQVLQISSIDETDITEETYLHLRARRSSLSGFSRRSWGGGGGRRGSSMSGSLRGSVSGSVSGSFADGGEDQLYEDDPTLLPPGWSIMVDATTKKAYYWNEVSGEMTRLKPIWTRTFAKSTAEGGRFLEGQQSLTPSKLTPLLQGIDEGEEETTVQGIGRMHVRIRSFSDEAM